MHQGGAVADQRRDMMRVAGGGGVDQQVGVAAQAVAHQPVMHRAGGQQGVDRQPVVGDGVVGQHQQRHARAHRRRRLGADPFDGGPEAFAGRVVQVDDPMRVAAVGVGQQRPVATLGQHRRVGGQPRRVGRAFLEQVALGAQTGFQRHHHRLAQRVDRRVGDLGELLAEVVVQRARPRGQHGERGVVAHRADRFLTGFGQHPQHLVALLEGHPEQLLIDVEGVRRQRLRLGLVPVQRAQALDVAAQPAPVGVAAFEVVVDVGRREQPAGFDVDRQHFAGLHPALGHHLLGGVVVHADLRGDGEVAVLGDDVAGRAQAVAVQHAAGVAAVGEHDAGRAVPRLQVHRVVLVEGAQVRVHVLDVLPGRRDQQAHGAKQVHAAHHQHFQHVVQRAGVRAGHVDQRPDFGHVGQQARGKGVAAGLGPVAVAADGVDFAVMGQIAERLRQPPLWQGVGGKTLVEQADRGLQPLVAEVGIEHRQVGRHHQPLVADQPTRQRRHVVDRIAGADALVGAAASDEQVALEHLRQHPGRRVDENLRDVRQGVARFLAAGVGVDRHRPPAGDLEPLPFQLRVQVGAGGLGQGRVAVEEHHADAVMLAQLDAGRGGGLAQEPVGFAHQQAAAVAGFAVGGDRAAVGEPRQGVDGGMDQPVARPVIHLGDQSETATVSFEFRPVQTGGVARLLHKLFRLREEMIGRGKTNDVPLAANPARLAKILQRHRCRFKKFSYFIAIKTGCVRVRRDVRRPRV